MKSPLRVGVFAGSFNPIHVGHLALANWMAEFGDMDEVRFVVSPHNPLKEEEILVDGQQRLGWVRSATADYPKISVSDVEFHLPRPSYTLRTFEELSQSEPDKQFSLLIGSDNWEVFDQWKDYYEFLVRYPVVIFPRPGYPLSSIDGRFPQPSKARLRTVSAPQFDISSSFIRESIRQGKDVRYFLPEGIRHSVFQAFTGQK
ncbi:MAG: nicotinate-nucleotide adenylyltransferase [Tannerellaceae bacterium]|jgi:nicotinate-nucleotide adenylyltransferase|nr:nicotinate-nucleotide adenylyltransferase [Tannerellaceae bacterium]